MASAGEKRDVPPRLLIVVNVFHPDRGGGGAIFSDLAYGLYDRGFDVTVRCAYPYYPEWRNKTGRNGLRIQRYEDKGVHVERYGLFIPRNPQSLVQRLLYEASFFFSLLRSLPRGREFDLTMVYCPLVGAVAFAALHKRLHGRPLWLNVQDLSAQAAAASGIAPGRFASHWLSRIQAWLFNRADVWSTISPVMRDRLETIRTRNQPILYLPNWLNNSLAREIHQRPSKQGRLPADVIKLLYAGNIGGKQDLLRFCSVLHQSDAPFAFRIHGDGARAGEVQEWIEETGDRRFLFGPFLDEARFAEALYEADLFVITEKTGSGGSFIPCKTIAGVAAGTPILAVSDKDSPLGREVIAHDLGPWFSWEAVPEVPRALARLRNEPDRFMRWQLNALERAAFYDREHVLDAFEHALRVLLRSSPPYAERDLSGIPLPETASDRAKTTRTA